MGMLDGKVAFIAGAASGIGAGAARRFAEEGSDMSRHVSGVAIYVDGGVSLLR